MTAPLKLSRERLLNTTARLFAERGYDGTSISTIIAELGVARPTLYTHTRSKEELMGAILDQVLEFYRKQLSNFVRPEDPPLKRIKGYVELQLEVTARMRNQLLVVLRHFDDNVRRHPEIRDWWRELDAALVEAINEAIERGELSPEIDPVILKHSIWAVLNDLPLWYRIEGRIDREQLVDQLLFMFSAGVVRPGEK